MGILLMTGAFSASPAGTKMEGYFLLLVMIGLVGSFTTTLALALMVMTVLTAGVVFTAGAG
jgi:hypothetical protein